MAQVQAVEVVRPGPQGPKGDRGLVGINAKGSYQPTETYSQRDTVTVAGATYLYTGSQPSSDLPPGPNWTVLVESGDKNYVHNQAAAAAEWLIEHNLGKFPAVNVLDSSGAYVEGCVKKIDENTILIEFSAAFSGKATLN